MTSSSSWLDDPAWLPHALTADSVVMAHATPERLRAASFLDGREPFADATRQLTHAAFAGAAQRWPSEPVPMLCHVSFCGSTLLSRLLDVPGRTIVYREPAIHIALADRASAGVPSSSLLAQSTRAFARPVGGARALVKPTSWANALLPAWAAQKAIDPLFITMAPRMFLCAVFRGGRDRIGFAMRLAQHLAPLMAGAREWIVRVADERAHPLDTAARLTLIALAVQCALMRQARATLGLDDAVVIDASTIFATPRDAAGRAAALIGVAMLESRTADAHAKAPGRPFSAADEASANRAIEQHHATRFDHALSWGERLGLRYDA